MNKDSKAALDAMEAARDFPAHTCGVSRHTALIADQLMSRGSYPMLSDDPGYCGQSLAWTVAALWKARKDITNLQATIAKLTA